MNEKLVKIKELLSSLLIDEEASKAEVEKFGSVTTESGILYWEGEEELKVEDKVYVAEDEEGQNKVEAEDGDYKIEDGTIYRVKDGKVAEIVEPEVEEDPAPAPTPEETEESEETETALSKFQAEIQKYEESYQEKEQKIAEAISKAGAVDFWVVEAGDDYAIINVWDQESQSSKYIKYAIAWGEDGEATATLLEEVVSAFIPKEVKEEIEEETPEVKKVEETQMEDEPAPAPTPETEETETKEEEEDKRDLEKEIDELKEIVDELKKKLEGIEEEKPATPQEEFEAITDDSKLSLLERYGRALRD